jgi:hypothetical protein
VDLPEVRSSVRHEECESLCARHELDQVVRGNRAEFDINPLKVLERSTRAVDVRVRVKVSTRRISY